MSINKTDKITLKGVLIFLPFFVFIIFVIISSEKKYTRHLELSGIVVSIEWKSSNHNLPSIVVLEKSGRRITISHSTFVLDESNLKVGDEIVKKFGSIYCFINGEKVKCSKN